MATKNKVKKSPAVFHFTEPEVEEAIKLRYTHLKKKDNRRAIDVEKKIVASLKAYFNKYPVDFIIETLTHFGQAPAIVYDDNGLFAVSGGGYGPVVTGRNKIVGSMTVLIDSKRMWKKSIRAALKNYLDKCYRN